MWSGWNSQSHSIREVVEFNWGVFLIDSGVWVVLLNGEEMTEIGLSSRGLWMMVKEGMSGKGRKSHKKDTKKDQNWSGWSQYDG